MGRKKEAGAFEWIGNGYGTMLLPSLHLRRRRRRRHRRCIDHDKSGRRETARTELKLWYHRQSSIGCEVID